MSDLQVVTSLEAARHLPDYPAPIPMPLRVLGEHSIDDNSSAGFHELRTAHSIDVRAALRPSLADIVGVDAVDRWLGPRVMPVIDVALSTDMPDSPLSHQTIWLFLNAVNLEGVDPEVGFAIPAARRVMGSHLWLAPLCLPLEQTVYAANLGIQYGPELRANATSRKFRALHDYFRRFPIERDIRDFKAGKKLSPEPESDD